MRKGVQFLIDSHAGDGTWVEDAFTGTGFPRVFYLKYHLYRVYFPMMALARYHAAVGRLAAPATSTPGALASRIPATPQAFDL